MIDAKIGLIVKISIVFCLVICDKNDLTNVLKSQNFDCNIKGNIEFYKQHSIDKISNKIMKVYEII